MVARKSAHLILGDWERPELESLAASWRRQQQYRDCAGYAGERREAVQ
jgi:hypothetical protein